MLKKILVKNYLFDNFDYFIVLFLSPPVKYTYSTAMQAVSAPPANSESILSFDISY